MARARCPRSSVEAGQNSVTINLKEHEMQSNILPTFGKHVLAHIQVKNMNLACDAAKRLLTCHLLLHQEVQGKPDMKINFL